MEITLTHTGPIPFDDFPDGSLFICRMCNFEKNPNASHYNGRIFLLRHYKSGDYATLTMPGCDFGYFYKGEYAKRDLQELTYDAWEPVTFKVKEQEAELSRNPRNQLCIRHRRT